MICDGYKGHQFDACWEEDAEVDGILLILIDVSFEKSIRESSDDCKTFYRHMMALYNQSTAYIS